MYNELVFSTALIFDNTTLDGALGRHGAGKYFIAPYQRGYKWKSDKDGAVTQLMTDLLAAFNKDSKELYLNYITTQVNKFEGETVLELIDGQQRLTTLTLLYAVIAGMTGNEEINAASNKLSYQIRKKVSQFFSTYIYDPQQVPELFSQSWETFVETHPYDNEQDIYFLFHAVRHIFDRLSELGDDLTILKFADYIGEHVKIILNNIEGNINCEKIFSNLNNNKVELTDVELIKGLLLTRSSRAVTGSRQLGYKQVLEIRALLGRQWDEIAAWTAEPDISALYFSGETPPIEQLLRFLAVVSGYQPEKDKERKYALFNFFQNAINDDAGQAAGLFNELKIIKQILNNWYGHPAVYNTVGFLFHARDSGYILTDLKGLLKSPIKTVEQKIRRLAFAIIPENIAELDYQYDKAKIHRVLLSLSVFHNKDKVRFDFTAYNAGSWSLEHIFPRSPDVLPDRLEQKDIELINQLMTVKFDDLKRIKEKIPNLKMKEFHTIKRKLSRSSCELVPEEKMLIYRLIKTDKLNKMGNMALLTGGDNSSNSNGMFSKKRHNIIARISAGSFVPKHTYDIFSKLISAKMTTDNISWTENDIDNHQIWMVEKVEIIRKDLAI
ncbi:GmrSD restriction endonuclease domain-containing protein [Mucilaginibacter sp. X5P1]|uniref:GmrSD restriction endonuclease domain-containing protein n=1 Tax=Mucilaginibacter sp. X5P1 TaxID=2723088 RepID=UPI00161F8350|nr:DUF262 domain-containing protein [Mucilaginibacter sp. X5P1]MBB6139880.1 hypothetical protein [Mucilaginibacter sp. X5P1]